MAVIGIVQLPRRRSRIAFELRRTVELLIWPARRVPLRLPHR